MKLNFRLDLNTIVLLLLIVVFSVIIYYSMKKYSVFEGLVPTSLQEANKKIKEAQTSLDALVEDKKKFDEAMQNLQGQTTIVNNETDYIRDTASLLYTKVITPNLHIMDSQLNVSQGILDGYNRNINEIKTRLNLTSTANNLVSAAIQGMITAQTSARDQAKIELDNLIKFTVKEPITAADRSAVITIEKSSVDHPTYTITSIPTTADLKYTFDANPDPGTAIATVTGLTNNTSYTFKIVADYGSNIIYEVTTITAVVPRGKPSVSVVGFTGYADVTIVPPSDGLEPNDYTISSDPAVSTLPVTQKPLTKRINGLINNTTYTISVVANYDGGSSLSATSTVTPRNAPTGTVQCGNKSAIVTVVPPIGNTTPTSYLVSGYKSLQSTSTVPMKQFPVSNTTATFVGLENGTEYTFNIVAIYPDDSRSSPSTAPLKVTPYDAPKPDASVNATDGGAKLTITKPITSENITGYEVRVYRKDNSAQVWSKTINSLEYNIPGLVNNRTYIISVVAKYTYFNSDKVEKEVTPKREPFTTDNVNVVRTAVNLMFSIKNPVSSMSSFSIKIRNGSNSGETKTSNAITDSLWFGEHRPDTEYAFDITLTYTDGTKVVLSNKKYTTLAAPEITAIKTKDDIRIKVERPHTNMSSFSIIQQNGKGKGEKAESPDMGKEISTRDPLRPFGSNVEYEFDVFIKYKDGQIYKKNNAKFRTLK